MGMGGELGAVEEASKISCVGRIVDDVCSSVGKGTVLQVTYIIPKVFLQTNEPLPTLTYMSVVSSRSHLLITLYSSAQLHGTALHMRCFLLCNLCGTLAQNGAVGKDMMRQCHSNVNCTLLPVAFQNNVFKAHRHTQVPNLGEMLCTYHSTH